MRGRQRNRFPLVVALIIFAGAAGYAGYLLGRDDTSGSSGGGPAAIESDASTPTSASTSESEGGDSTTTTLVPVDGTFAPPVTVHSDTLGDLEFDAVIDDYTPTDPPDTGSTTSTVDPALVTGDRIDANLPDGVYWARPVGTFDEDVRGINLDVLDSPDFTGSPRLYPAFVNDILFVSLHWSDGPTGQNASVSPATFWSLVDSGVESVDLPDAGGSATVRGLFLLTIIDGLVVAVEGVRNP